MKKFVRFIFIAALPVFVGGCGKDYLDTLPTDRVSSDKIFSSLENATTAVNGIYRFMFARTTLVTDNTQNKPGVGGVMLALDFMGEDLGISSSNWYTSTGEGNWVGHRNESHALMEFDYRTFYKIIGDANFILDNVGQVNASEDQRNVLRSQALILRAYAYSFLVQLYGKRYSAVNGTNSQLGVPLVLKSGDVALPRATVEEVYAAIIKDLDSAISMKVSSRANKSQANIDVAIGLRARVALIMQDYDNAILYAKQLIALPTYKLMTHSEYLKGFNDANALSEFIWASMPTADQDAVFASYFSQIGYNANTSFMRANPKRINSALYDRISATDVRKNIWEPNPTAANFPLPLTTFSRQPYMSRKFSIKAAGGTLGDVPLMRLAEIYLIAAEAYVERDQDQLARDILYEFMKARDPEAVRSTKSGQALTEEIWIQRRIELWGEGFRFLDLKRLNQPLKRTIVPNYVSGSVNGLMEVPAGDKRWEFLFPRTELDANPNIVQNEI
ncbi:RagB/SusD family nutrient uptake outer membrane protein [Sphingobacterium sp. 18053]|uniref:RagB/SusD family nutrient uptake outer membrane protein n=1 Tax=Sphingobacterium sp. 18053 TaxID=2681401 RepID=UPI001356D690|nr:RagB/SusD family nutrient uptake outer membrane protein [Sphingobacterium sp. 18053]